MLLALALALVVLLALALVMLLALTLVMLLALALVMLIALALVMHKIIFHHSVASNFKAGEVWKTFVCRGEKQNNEG